MIILTLLGLMTLAVLVSTIELAVILFRELMKPLLFLLNIQEMLEIFGFFLMGLIGLEHLDTIKSYLEVNRIHADVVFLVVLVAVSRKVIIVDYKEITLQVLFLVCPLSL